MEVIPFSRTIWQATSGTACLVVPADLTIECPCRNPPDRLLWCRRV